MAALAAGLEAAVFERAAEVFSLLSTPTRLRILAALCDGELCVGDLVAAVDLPQSTVSQHLSLLFRSGLLSRRKEGSQVYYRVEPDTRSFLCHAVRSLVPDAIGASPEA